MLGVVASVLAVVCKRVQQLLTMLGPALHLGTDTTHKTLQTMRNTRAWPEQCWKNCANGSNVVALRFCDHGTKEMLGVAGSKVWLVSNFAQQLPTTCNRVCKRPGGVTSKNVGSCWPTMLRPFAWDLTLMTAIAFFDVLLAVTILVLCLSYNIHVKSTGHILSYMTLNTTFFQQFLLVSHRSENINRIFSG